jgi:hypothetical protein
MKALRAAGAKKRTISTSEARKHFAAALKTVHKEKMIIGFDRYTMSVAALVPVEAVYVLAGRGREIDPAVLDKIERMAARYLHNAPAPKAAQAAKKRAAKKAPAKKKKAVGRPRSKRAR